MDGVDPGEVTGNNGKDNRARPSSLRDCLSCARVPREAEVAVHEPALRPGSPSLRVRHEKASPIC